MTDAADPAVARALAYPFDPPHHAYVIAQGVVRDFTPEQDGALLRHRHGVLAVGSNASPQRLREKFGPHASLAVTLAQVAGYVVAHSAKFAGYAAIPATLHPWPGAQTQLHVTWLTDEQLAVMDETETLGVAYDRVTIAPVRLEDAPAQEVPIETYVSRSGAFGIDGRPAVSAAARITGAADLPVLTQQEIQRRAMDVLGVAGALHAFIGANAQDAAVRDARSSQLSKAVGLPFAAAGA